MRYVEFDLNDKTLAPPKREELLRQYKEAVKHAQDNAQHALDLAKALDLGDTIVSGLGGCVGTIHRLQNLTDQRVPGGLFVTKAGPES